MQNSVDRPATSTQQQDTLKNMTFALHCVAEAVVWTDADGCIQGCNRAFEHLVNQTALAGQALSQLLPLTIDGELLPTSGHPASWSLANQQRCKGQYGFWRHDRRFLLDLKATPLPDSERDNASDRSCEQSHNNEPGIQGVMLVIRDITPPSRSTQTAPLAPAETVAAPDAACACHESESWFRSIFAMTAVGMVIASFDGTLLQVNVAIAEMLGYTPTELLAKPCRQLVHPDDFARGQAPLQQLLAGEIDAYHLERRYFHKQGDIVWGLLSVSAVRDEAQVRYVVYQIQDITDRKQAELALRELNQVLEKRVQRRTVQLETANQQLQAEIAEHEKTEAALRKNEAQFRTCFEHAPIAISLADAHTYQIVKVNQAHHTLFGYSKAELATMTYVDFTHPDDIGTNIEQVKQLLDGTIDRFQIEKRFVKKDGTCIWTTLTVTLVQELDGRTYSMAMIEDITARKQTEATLKLAQFSIDCSTDPIWWVCSDGTISYVNDSACRDLGYERDAIVGQHVTTFNPGFSKAGWSAHWQEMKQRKAFTFESRHRHKEGMVFPVEVTVNYLELNGDEYHCSIVRNITDRKRAEDQLRASLQEKEILLKEVHHRVKNNLQTVYSLLNLQANTIQDPRLLLPFKDSQSRVKAMALIHEKLYQSEQLANLNFDDYVHHLVADLVRSYSTNPASIHVQIEIAKLELPIDIVLPCGLILNELISNALKYAFPNDRAGTLQVGFSVSATHHYHLIIADNGIGIPECMALPHETSVANTLGLQLVQAFVQQLRGTVTIDRTVGTRFEILFPIPA